MGIDDLDFRNMLMKGKMFRLLYRNNVRINVETRGRLMLAGRMSYGSVHISSS